MKKINIAEKSFNPFDLIGQKWMLISAGTEDKWNTMTASWGAVGVMWGKPSATCYIRKSRFTKEFVDAGEILTPALLAPFYLEMKGASEETVKFHSPAQFVSNFSDSSVSSFAVSCVWCKRVSRISDGQLQ